MLIIFIPFVVQSLSYVLWTESSQNEMRQTAREPVGIFSIPAAILGTQLVRLGREEGLTGEYAREMHRSLRGNLASRPQTNNGKLVLAYIVRQETGKSGLEGVGVFLNQLGAAIHERAKKPIAPCWIEEAIEQGSPSLEFPLLNEPSIHLALMQLGERGSRSLVITALQVDSSQS